MIRASAIFAFFLLTCGPLWAQDEEMGALRAGFLLNFAKLTSWPTQRIPAEDTPLHVCLMKEDPATPAIQGALAGKSADTHPLEVEVISLDERSAKTCHLAFLGAALQARYAQMLPPLAAAGVLVIDEGPRFSWPDGMIRLYLEDGRMRFEVNPGAIEKAQLRLDPRVVRLARIATR